MNKTGILLIFLAFVASAFTAALFIKGEPAAIVSNSQVMTLQDGQQLYQQNCASCHGIDLQGEPNWRSAKADGSFPAPPHDETGHTWHHDDAYLFNYTKFGGQGIATMMGLDNPNSRMPAFQDSLTDAQILVILDYIKSTWPQSVREIQAARNAE